MSHYRRVLAAIDVSEEGRQVVEAAAAIVGAFDAELHIMHVVEPASLAYGPVIHADLHTVETGQMRRHAETRLAELAKEFRVARENVHVLTGRTISESTTLRKPNAQTSLSLAVTAATVSACCWGPRPTAFCTAPSGTYSPYASGRPPRANESRSHRGPRRSLICTEAVGNHDRKPADLALAESPEPGTRGTSTLYATSVFDVVDRFDAPPPETSPIHTNKHINNQLCLCVVHARQRQPLREQV